MNLNPLSLWDFAACTPFVFCNTLPLKGSAAFNSSGILQRIPQWILTRYPSGILQPVLLLYSVTLYRLRVLLPLTPQDSSTYSSMNLNPLSLWDFAACTPFVFCNTLPLKGSAAFNSSGILQRIPQWILTRYPSGILQPVLLLYSVTLCLRVLLPLTPHSSTIPQWILTRYPSGILQPVLLLYSVTLYRLRVLLPLTPQGFFNVFLNES